MVLQLFLNDLSSPMSLEGRQQSISYLRGLVLTVRAARVIDDHLILNCANPVNEMVLGAGATIASIRNDGDCVEEAQYLKTLNNRAPLSASLAEVGGADPNLFEYKIPVEAPISPGAPATALGLSHMLKGLGISLPTHDLWRAATVDLDLDELDQQGDISARLVIARNASNVKAVQGHEESLRADLRPPFRTGKELWALKGDLFANLVFIPRTRSQIEAILAGDPLLDQVWIKLSGLDKAIATWRVAQTAYPMFPFNVRPESSRRMVLVIFNDAAGIKRTFSDHADLAPIEGRVHFIVESKPHRHALIGHIGRKLGIG